MRFPQTGQAVFALLLFFSSIIQAQDAAFTQYYQVPGQINPALSGSFGGLYRVGFSYRSQWTQAVQSGFVTSSASGDVKFLLGDKKSGQDIAALGILFISDRVKIYDHNITGIYLTGAFHKSLDKTIKQYIGGGVQLGIYQTNANYEDLFFQDQFNAIDAYDRPTGENLPVNNFGTLDINIGVNYSVSPAKRQKFVLGGAFYHLTAQNQSFFEKVELQNNNLDLDFPVPRRFNVYTSYETPVSETVVFNPRVLYMNQGKHNQALATALFKFRQKQDDTKEFFLGTSVRAANDISGMHLESLILQGGLEYKGLIFGLSYDHNVMDLFDTRQGLGSFELSVNFLGEYENENTFCPSF